MSDSGGPPAPGQPRAVPLPVTGDPAADRLLAENPFALLVGMLLDQQVPLEWAFAAPARLRDRLGPERFSPDGVASMPPEELEAAFLAKPALHRFPAAMARRTAALAQHLVEHYGGDTAALWMGVESGDELFRRVRELPGFGEEKAKIFVALLAKRFAVRPDGWQAVTQPFHDDQPRSVADIDSAESFARVKEWKKRMRAAGKTKQDRPED